MAAAASEYKIFGLGLLGQVFVGMAVAIIAGLLLKSLGVAPADFPLLGGLCTFFGTVFLASIKMVVPTLIFFALLSGVLSMGDGLAAGRVAGKSILAFLGTALCAVLLGVVCGLIFRPGEGLGPLLHAAEAAGQTPGAVPTAGIRSLGDFFVSLKPINPVEAMAQEKYIQIIYFVFFLGFVINAMRKSSEQTLQQTGATLALWEQAVTSPAAAFEHVQRLLRDTGDAKERRALSAASSDPQRAFDYARERLHHLREELAYAETARGRLQRLQLLIADITPVMFKMIEYVVRLAPLAVFGTITLVVWTQGLATLLDLKGIIFATLFACALQVLLFGAFIALFGRLDPRPFFRKLLPIQGLAFSTSSSKATLRFAMQHMQDSLGVSARGANFILPLGASINMDGTAIYLAIATMFFAQAMGIDLTFAHYMILIAAATVGSIGAAGIPSGSLIFIGIVAGAVGINLTPAHIGIIMTVDRLLDMVRTTVNITGDCALTLIIESSEKTVDERVYYDEAA